MVMRLGLGDDQKNAVANTSFEMKFLGKIKEVAVLDKVRENKRPSLTITNKIA